jgi:ParB/RepB/Spo0J family partition protein
MAVELRSTYDLTINPVLRDLIHAVGKETDDALRATLIASGGVGEHHPIVIRRETNEIVDGHRRYRFCKELGLPYCAIYKSFPTMAEVIEFMFDEQIPRRNSTPQQLAVMTASQHESRSKKVGSSRATAEIAKQSGKSERTVYRATEYKTALESLAADVQAKLKSGEIKSSLASVVAFANASPEYQKAIIANIESGLHASLQAALKTDDDEKKEQDGPETPKSTDTLSVKTKGGKKPSAKPAADMVREAQAFLGKLDRTIDEVHEMLPESRRHAECRSLLKQLGDRLKAWWREAE